PRATTAIVWPTSCGRRASPSSSPADSSALHKPVEREAGPALMDEGLGWRSLMPRIRADDQLGICRPAGRVPGRQAADEAGRKRLSRAHIAHDQFARVVV